MTHNADGTKRGIDADIERVEAMRAAGTISDEEARRLIEVLRDVDAAEGDIEGIGAVAEASPPPDASSPDAPAPDATLPAALDPSPPPPAPTPPRTATASATTGPAAGAATRWVRVEILAGDVVVEGGDVAEPILHGAEADVALERVGDDWRVYHTRGWFERGHRDVRLTVPRDVGVRLDVKAGEVRVKGVRAVAGRMMAGDLTIDGAEAIDLHKSAGDLDARLRLTRGRHTIRASAGDVDVTLLEGSDVAVSGRVSMGDARGPRGFESSRRGMGASVSGKVGAGSAELEVRLSAGDVTIESEARDA